MNIYSCYHLFIYSLLIITNTSTCLSVCQYTLQIGTHFILMATLGDSISIITPILQMRMLRYSGVTQHAGSYR